MDVNWWLLIPGIILLVFGLYKWIFDSAPRGHEDDDGFHYD